MKTVNHDTDKFIELVKIVTQWFKDEEIDLGWNHHLVMGRMASRIQSLISQKEKKS
jgi:hypothetical protein